MFCVFVEMASGLCTASDFNRPEKGLRFPFAPGDSADAAYGKLFREAISKGVEVIPCSFGFFLDHITWEGVKPLYALHFVITKVAQPTKIGFTLWRYFKQCNFEIL